MSARDYEKMSYSEKKKEDWMNAKWRPMMGWTYMLTCIADFVVFPILWSVLQSISKGQVNIQWQPITLQGAGLFHIAMGAILGIAAYGRTQEKLNGANNGGLALPANVGTTYTPPPTVGQSATGNFGLPVATTVTQTFGNGSNQYGQPQMTSYDLGYNTPSLQTPQVGSFKGKPMPVQPQEPEL